MRALLVVCNPNLPDIVYFSGDETFCKRINLKAEEKGWIQEEGFSSSKQVDLNILLQYFQSLIASQQALSSMLNCPYQSLQGEDGTLIVVRQQGEFLFIALNGDNTETESFLLHKIFILQRIIAFFFGPIPERLGCGNDRTKQLKLWNTVTRILDTWAYLYHVEQSFLMEAVERLNVNQFLNGICIGLLEKTLSAASDKHAVHALLLVKGKLLALYSSQNAPELQPSNILMITLVAESFYPSKRNVSEVSDDFLKDMTVVETGRKVGTSQFYVAEDYISATEDNKSDNSSNYYSPHQGNSPFQSDLEEDGKAVNASGLSAAFGTPSDSTLEDTLKETPETYSTPQTSSRKGAEGGKERKRATSSTSSASKVKTSYPEEGFHLYIFLQQQNRRYVPHRLTLIPVLPGINMVVISERKSSFGINITDGLDLAGKLFQKVEEVLQKGPKHNLVSRLDDTVVKEIIGYLKDMKSDTRIWQEKLLQPLERIKAACSKNNAQDNDRKTILQSELETLTTALKSLFQKSFLNHQTLIQEVPEDTLDGHLSCQSFAQRKLEYYEDYLAVKGEKNFTMMTYLDSFPGLVHFIHVDRGSNQLTAPSIHIDYSREKKAGKEDAHRKLVWSFIEKSRHFFQNEHTTIHFQIGDFQLSSFLYFENDMGNLLPTPSLPKVPREGHYPGLQAEVFFRYITEQGFQSSSEQVRCCELHCIHLAVVPLNIVAQQARKLREHLWETCGVTSAAVNLL